MKVENHSNQGKNLPESASQELRVITDRYNCTFTEIKKGGPAGYESSLVSNVADPASDQFYSTIKKLNNAPLIFKERRIEQRNEAELLDFLNKKGGYGMASGFKPSGPFHFGHKLTSETLAFFQRNGGQVFMPVADLEAKLDTDLSEKEYTLWAADNLLDWGACGVDLDAAHVYLQSEERRVNEVSYLLARGLNFSLPLDIYGAHKFTESFPFLFAGITQVADIILPQYPDFGNKHCMLLSGPDQDGHMKMTQALVERTKNSLPGYNTMPSAVYIPHIRGLTGEKASSSQPESTIYLGGNRKNFEKLSLKERVSESIRKVEEAKKQNFDEYQAFEESMVSTFCELEGQAGKNFIPALEKALTEHYERKKEVFEYALNKKSSKTAKKPSFWKSHQNAIVDENKRNKTQWYDLVCNKQEEVII